MAERQAQSPKSPAGVPDLTGTTVGRFAVRARLGAGGMGEVYRADDTKLRRAVALKRMAPELRADERYRRRFLKEAERASALTDPHIAGLYDVLEENGEIFLVMEYVDGVTLRQRLQEPLSIKEFLAVAVQCAAALVTAHEKGILHRDLKPENIMLTPTGQVKILDFGVAKRLPLAGETLATESLTGTAGGLSGTPAYMAPEVLLEEEPDGRADIFSLGVVFYEALTGRHPFRAGSFLATSDRILHEVPPPLTAANPRVSAELERIVTKMLAKEPAERYATAADLLVDLRALARGPRPGPRPRWWTRRRVVAAALAVVALAAAVLLLVPSVQERVARWLGLAAVPAERIRVAVLPFANQTGDERLERYRLTLTHMLMLDLTGSPNIQVLPYERLLEVTRGLPAEGKDISSAEAIQAVANYSNSQFVVVPAMYAVGSTLRVSAEFRDARTGETVGATKAERVLTGSAENTLYSMEGELADGIQKYFKRMGRGQEYRTRPEGSRPNTVAAALHLTEGRTAYARGNYAQALRSFQRVVDADPGFALAYAWMGQIYGLLGYDDKARALSEKAAQLITGQMPLTDAYFIEANLAERKYDYAAAENKYSELIRLYPDDPAWHVGLAGVYEQQGQYAKAIASYQEALRRDSSYIVAYQKLGVLYGRRGELPQAFSQGKKALDLYRAVRNPEGEASALVDLAELFRLQRDYPQARESAQAALKLFQTLGNEIGVLRATKTLGDILANEGDWKTARRYYLQVVSESGEIRNNRSVVLALMNLGVLYTYEGDRAKAVEYYQRSLAQGQLYGEYKDWPSLRGRGLTLSNLSGVYVEYGPDPKQGLQLAQEALAINQKMGATEWEARDRMHLGMYYMNAGQYEQAFKQLQQAQALARSIEHKQLVAQSAFNLGRWYFLQNQYEPALESLGNAFALFQDLHDGFRATMLQIHVGWTYGRVGDTAKARSLLEEGLQAVKKNGYGELLPDAYNALGELYQETGEKERTRQSFQQASALWREPYVSEFTIEARSALGLLEAERGNSARGVSQCREAVARARQLQRLHTRARTLLNLARTQLLRKDYASTLDALQEFASLGERDLGLEFRAQADFIRGKVLEGQGKTEEAKASYRQAQEAIRQLQQTLAAGHRESFAQRRDVQVLLR